MDVKDTGRPWPTHCIVCEMELAEGIGEHRAWFNYTEAGCNCLTRVRMAIADRDLRTAQPPSITEDAAAEMETMARDLAEADALRAAMTEDYEPVEVYVTSRRATWRERIRWGAIDFAHRIVVRR